MIFKMICRRHIVGLILLGLELTCSTIFWDLSTLSRLFLYFKTYNLGRFNPFTAPRLLLFTFLFLIMFLILIFFFLFLCFLFFLLFLFFSSSFSHSVSLSLFHTLFLFRFLIFFFFLFSFLFTPIFKLEVGFFSTQKSFWNFLLKYMVNNLSII